MDDRQHRMEVRIAEAKGRFLTELSDRLLELERAFGLYLLEGDDEQGNQIARVSHTLRGSAPMLGLQEIGLVAGHIEDLWTSHEPTSVDIVRKYVDTAGHIAKLRELAGATSPYSASSPFNLNEAELIVPTSLPAHVLVVDDDDVLRNQMQTYLQGLGYQVDGASSVDDAVLRLEDRTYDLVVLDLVMAPKPGSELLHMMSNHPSWKWTPLVVVSALNSITEKQKVFRAGAGDYVTKPFDLRDLAVRIYGLIERRRLYDALAYRDALTGLYNRRYFTNEMVSLMARAQRYGVPLTMVYLDVDRFKKVNDELGHSVGDVVLQGFSLQVQKVFRETDIAARLGGEEFAVVCIGTHLQEGINIAERLRACVEREPSAKVDGEPILVTCSIGVAEWVPGTSLEEWLRTVDGALYQAKNGGRNRVIAADGGSTSRQEIAVSQLGHQQSRKRVVIADDDALIRTILSSRLSSLPVDIEEVENGEALLSALSAHKTDLCIVDGMMPSVDGFTAVEQIRSQGQFSDLKILMLSSRRKETDVVRGLMIGANDYMVKPFSPVELEIRVRRLLELEKLS